IHSSCQQIEKGAKQRGHGVATITAKPGCWQGKLVQSLSNLRKA
ncbi:1698_t:CDS:1, partial [Gigaspora margarita]